MKLLFVTCLKESRDDVKAIFHQAGIKVFSMTPTTGVKDERDENLLDDWFGSREGEFDSLFLFSFTHTEKASMAIRLIREYNARESNSFPIRGFVMPVEESSYES